jgi:hypothetical protein
MVDDLGPDGDVQHRFAADVLDALLAQLTDRNHQPWTATLAITHAWVDGAAIYVVYTTGSSNATWGWARDTRTSLIDPGPWPDATEAARYYRLLDFDSAATAMAPTVRDTIQWYGDRLGDLPQQPTELRDSHRHVPADVPSCTDDSQGLDPSELADKAGDLGALLRVEGHEKWARWLDTDARRIDAGDIYGLQHLLSAFGGMGSLSDLHVAGADPQRGQRIDRLMGDVAAMARELWRQAEHPGPDQPVINPPRLYADPRD